MPKVKTISRDAIEGAKKALAGLPQPVKESFTILETIEEMKDDIKGRLDEGHSVDTIVDALNKNGIEITPARFKTMWGKLYPSRKRKARKAKTPVFGDGSQFGQEGLHFGEASTGTEPTTGAGPKTPE